MGTRVRLDWIVCVGGRPGGGEEAFRSLHEVQGPRRLGHNSSVIVPMATLATACGLCSY